MGNRPGGNNPTGRNSAISPRNTGNSLMQVNVDLREIQQFLAKTRTDVGKLERVFVEANTALAESLASYQQHELSMAIESHGRPQYRGNKLVEIITSPQNRSVNADGFTVGRLDEIPHIRDYWRGLEFGSERHVGAFLPGYFVDNEGQPLPFRQGGRDPFAVRGTSLRRGLAPTGDPSRTGPKGGKSPFRARITHGIEGYHFQSKGYDAWKRNDGSAATIIATYQSYLARAGVDLGLKPGQVAKKLVGAKTKAAPRDPQVLQRSSERARAGQKRGAAARKSK